MNKAELIQTIAETEKISKAKTHRVIKQLFSLISQSLRQEKRFRLSGVGVFKAKSYPARKGYSPAVKREVDIPARTAVTLKASKAFRNAAKD